IRPRPAPPHPVLDLAALASPRRCRLLDPHRTSGPRRNRRALTCDPRARGGRGAYRDRARHTPGLALGGPAALAPRRGGAHRRLDRALTPELLAWNADHRSLLAVSPLASQ